MSTTIFNSSSNRQYINGKLVEGLDIEGTYKNKNKNPKFNIKISSPLNKHYIELTDNDIHTFINKKNI